MPLAVVGAVSLMAPSSSSAEPRVSVVPFIGDADGLCARGVARSVASEVDLVLGIEAPEAPDYPSLREWFAQHRRRRVDAWVLGTLSLGRVVLEVYSARGELVGLGAFRPIRGSECRLDIGDAQQLLRWVARAPIRRRDDRRSSVVGR